MAKNNSKKTLSFDRLSVRERQVFLMSLSGTRGKDIAEKLRLSPKTISTYRVRGYKKLGLKNSAELLRYVLSHDLGIDLCVCLDEM